jgi:uncharacterized protein YbjT (DUF2867 family)
MRSRVFLTGASGFVGQAVLDELLNRGFDVAALVRTSDALGARPNVQCIVGDLLDPAVLDRGMNDCTAVIHLVGIIMEKPSKGITFEHIHIDGTRAVVDTAKRNGVTRFVQMSALGTRAGANSNYHLTKFVAEDYVRRSGLDWTILRPSLIHGPRGEFMRQEAMWARKQAPAPIFFMPFMPYFGAGLFGTGGAGELQPVFVGDVARAFVDCLEFPKTIGQTYELGGREKMTWPQLHHAISTCVVKKKRLVMPIPAWVAKFYAAIGIAPLLGFNRDHVLMSQEDATCDMSRFIADFGWEPGPFRETFARYCHQL